MQALASLCSFLQLEVLFQACIFVARMEFLLLVELRLLFTCWLENRAHSQILHVCMLSHVQLSCDPMSWSPPGSSIHGFSRQKCCPGLPFPPPCHFPHLGSEPTSPETSALAGGFFAIWATGEACSQFLKATKTPCHLVLSTDPLTLWISLNY